MDKPKNICPLFDVCGGKGNSNNRSKNQKHFKIESCPSKINYSLVNFIINLFANYGFFNRKPKKPK